MQTSLNTSSIDPVFAWDLARRWVAAWNRRDLPAVLALYRDDFVFHSPLIRLVVGEPTGTLCGKPAVRAYWQKAMQLVPTLHFELEDVLCGIDNVTVLYQGHRGRAAETLWLDSSRLISRAQASYCVAPPTQSASPS